MAPHRKPRPVFPEDILLYAFGKDVIYWMCLLINVCFTELTIHSLTSFTSIICTRRTDSPVCCWERSLNWCMYPVHYKLYIFRTSRIWWIYFCFNVLLYFCLFLSRPYFPFLWTTNSQLLFVVCFTVFLANCVDYDILFANKFVNHTDSSKVTLPDAFIPMDVCSSRWVRCSNWLTHIIPVHTKSLHCLV